MEVDSLEDDCVLPSETKEYAACPHGPMLLFSKRKDGRNYYACSASRDRKLCPFFLFADKKAPSAETLRVWKESIDAEKLKSSSAESDLLRLKRVKSQPPNERSFCREPNCSTFVLPDEVGLHQNHRLFKKVTDRQLKRPMELLLPLEDPKLNAQFIFDDKSVGVVANILDELKFHHVICLGAPRIHEAVKSKSPFRSFLLDIDVRFQTFFSSRIYARFNMFNAHFFSAESASGFREFLASCPTPPVIVVDPPFGGRVQPIFATMRSISDGWLEARSLNPESPDAKSAALKESSANPESGFLLPTFWAFPYFLEHSVQKERPEFRMLDYKVLYKNHPMFQNDKNSKDGNKKGSPIRFFTNVKPALIHLPEPDHKFCSAPECNRWVARANRHCAKCGVCPSKDGSTYTHCDVCQKCVKPSRIHCESCGRCEAAKHFCAAKENNNEKGEKEEEEDGKNINGEDEKCFNCGNPGHKRRHCPQNWAGGKRKKQHGKKGGGKKSKK